MKGTLSTLNELVAKLKTAAAEEYKNEGRPSARGSLLRDVIFDLDRARATLGRLVMDEENGS